jgi:hypothetical protein
MKQGDITIQDQAVVTPIPTAGAFSRDISLATGTQAVTGLGFKPSSIQFFSNVGNGNKVSFGYDDGTNIGGISRHDTPNFWQSSQNYSIRGTTGGADDYTGLIQSFDTDGFTISWIKTGTPTGTMSVFFTAFK